MFNHQSDSDRDLIFAFRQGESQASEILYRRYFPRMVQFCSRYLHSWEDGQDAAQDVFIKVLVEKKLSQFRCQSKLSSWLIRIAINVCKNQWRRKKANNLPDACESSNPQLESSRTCLAGLDPERDALREEAQNKVNDALNRLPPKYFRVIYSTYLEERSYPEASLHLNIPLCVLGVQLLRGKKILGKLIRQETIKRHAQWACSILRN